MLQKSSDQSASSINQFSAAPVDFSNKDELQNFQSVNEMHVINENSHEYQDTIQRLKLRVNHLQDRLALEEKNEKKD